MNDICPSCGGYTGNGPIVRQLPVANAAGEPYPIAEVPPVKLCACNRIAGSFLVGDGWDQGEIVDGTTDPRGLVFLGDGPGPEFVYLPKDAQVYPNKPASPALDIKITRYMTEEQARAMIREEVQRALYPAGTISGIEHRRVEMVEESGKRWRGVLYRVDEHATDPMLQAVRESVPTGICWACKRPGEALAMTWHGTHLIHATDECRELAARTPETREHRG